MGVVIDTTLLLEAERGSGRFEDLLRSWGEVPVGIAAITASELLHGCLRGPDPGTRARRSAFVEALIAIIPVWPFGLPEARRHADLWAHLAANGTRMGPNDLIVGATALARGYAVATLNPREFARVPGLSLVPIPPVR